MHRWLRLVGRVSLWRAIRNVYAGHTIIRAEADMARWRWMAGRVHVILSPTVWWHLVCIRLEVHYTILNRLPRQNAMDRWSKAAGLRVENGNTMRIPPASSTEDGIPSTERIIISILKKVLWWLIKAGSIQAGNRSWKENGVMQMVPVYGRLDG